MRIIISILLNIFIFQYAFTQSIMVNPVGYMESSLDAEELTREVLIDGGECSDISNFTLKENSQAAFPNANRSWGYFHRGESDFPFEEGIVLTTGFAHKVEGPHVTTHSDGNYSWTGDPDANTLANRTTNNATVFEFDFVPYGEEISFNYIFSSHEYPTFACSNYNDVFGFIISGPGITPDPGLSGKNIALLPNGLPVTINNVNDKECGDDTYYVPGNFEYISHRGRTTVLTASSDVIPGETYRIKLLVADSQDTLFDSAVYLEAGSFSLGSTLIDSNGIEVENGSVICDIEEFTIIANSTAPEANYQWYFNNTLIPGATQQEYTATETGTYKVEIFAITCQTEAEVFIVMEDSPEAEDVEISVCSPEGTYTFSLPDYEDQISSDPNVIHRYFQTFEGAEAGDPNDMIPNLLNYEVTGSSIVYVRTETANGCFHVSELELNVGTGPEHLPYQAEICDDNGDGFAEFDLTNFALNLLVGPADNVEFHYYLDAALTQPITTPEAYTNISNPQIIYVNIIDSSTSELCEAVEELTLMVDEFPEVQDDTITVCDSLNDNTEWVDLTQNNIVITEGINVEYEYFDINNNAIPNPTNYLITASPTTITVMVKNNTESCFDSKELTIILNPSIEVDNVQMELCSENGFATFHLPNANSDIYQNTENVDYQYYLSFDEAFEGNINNALSDDFTNTSNPQIIYARVMDENGCFNIAEVELSVSIGPDHIPFEAIACDDDGDGSAEFNLTNLAFNLLVGTGENIEFKYYLDENLTQEIDNPESYTNILNPQIIYVSMYDVTTEEACLVVEELTLVVNEFPEIQDDSIVICDNLNDNSEFVDLTQNDIVITAGINVNYHYFLEIGGVEITNPQNFEITSPLTTIYVLVRNQNGSCEEYKTITIEMLESPVLLESETTMENCSLDSYANFNLANSLSDFVNSTTGLEITYHLTFNQAFDGINPLPENYQNTSNGQIIYVRFENQNGCFNIGEIQLNVVLKHEVLPDVMMVCDDPYEISDGIAYFDLTQRHIEVENALGGINYEVSYYTSIQNAIDGINPIQDPTNFQNTSNPQTIYARAASGEQGCAGIVDFEVEVLEVPTFHLPPEVYFCIDDIDKRFEFFGEFDSYTWYDIDGNIISHSKVIDFVEEGTYTLEISSSDYECVARRDVEVIFDESPTILGVDVDGNTIKVNATGGFGPYKYSYNNGLTWFNSNVIHDVPSGIHEIIIQSKYGCYSEAKTFGVLGIPNFISPNGDGKNDYFEIRGLELYPNTNIKIFDRYGKLFVDRMIEPDFRWDGTYAGRNVASGDYWYIITLEDGRKITGNISVRNQ